jgi:hypothetical protein
MDEVLRLALDGSPLAIAKPGSLAEAAAVEPPVGDGGPVAH